MRKCLNTNNARTAHYEIPFHGIELADGVAAADQLPSVGERSIEGRNTGAPLRALDEGKAVSAAAGTPACP